MGKYIGGQAVSEGVMMRFSDTYAVSVRKGNKIRSMKKRLKQRNKWLRKPFIRGVTGFCDTLVLGIKTLSWSANQQADNKSEELSRKEFAWLIFTSSIFAIGVFFVAPLLLTNLLVKTKGVLFNLVDGIIRIAIFLGYLAVISYFKDVKRLFQYHGAEHKAVNCYEKEGKVSVELAKKYSTVHYRCGTTFLMIVLIVSIIVFSFITGSIYKLILSRIILLPVIAAISYELLFLIAKFHNNLIFRLLALPGLALQLITTKEPDKKQLEVAVHALKNLMG